MNSISRFLLLGIFLLSAGACRKDSKTTTEAPNLSSCSYQKSGALMLCTEYQSLSGTTQTSIQSECELRSAEGYSWAAGGCQGTGRAGSCALPASAQKPAAGTQYFYGEAFTTAGTAEGMCTAQGGTFKS